MSTQYIYLGAGKPKAWEMEGRKGITYTYYFLTEDGEIIVRKCSKDLCLTVSRGLFKDFPVVDAIYKEFESNGKVTLTLDELNLVDNER